jgi:heme/copper-type cytochrome/quinol oxidase subunit 2
MRKIFILSISLAMPFAAFAQNEAGNLQGLVQLSGNLVNMMLPIVSTLVVVFFFWGLAKYVLAAGDEEKAKQGKSIMIWGVLALFVMVTIWGIIGFMQNTLGNTGSATAGTITLPGVTPGQVTQ